MLILATILFPVTIIGCCCFMQNQYICALNVTLLTLCTPFLWPRCPVWAGGNHPSVLLHCWLGHLTCKIVSEMTYNVSSGTLNPTIPYHTRGNPFTSPHSTLSFSIFYLNSLFPSLVGFAPLFAFRSCPILPE